MAVILFEIITENVLVIVRLAMSNEISKETAREMLAISEELLIAIESINKIIGPKL